MKRLRYGPVGQEKPGLLDEQGRLRDLSGHIVHVGGHRVAACRLQSLRGAVRKPLSEGALRAGSKRWPEWTPGISAAPHGSAVAGRDVTCTRENLPMPPRPPLAQLPCPCGRIDARARPMAYAACCGRYLDHYDHAPAPDAESLMRSRYTAFALGRADYLLATWHASTRPATLQLDAAARFLGLEVRARRAHGDASAEVEFVARQRDATGRAFRLHERSQFVCEDGRWMYLDGEMDPTR